LAVEVEALVHTLIQHIFTQSFECASASPSLGGRQIRFLLKAPCILEALPMLAESRPGEEKKKHSKRRTLLVSEPLLGQA
jgi:hypothetical protein